MFLLVLILLCYWPVVVDSEYCTRVLSNCLAVCILCIISECYSSFPRLFDSKNACLLIWEMFPVDRLPVVFCGMSIIVPTLQPKWLELLQLTLLAMLWRCWLGVRKSTQPVKIERCGVDVVICLEQGAGSVHTVQLLPLHPNPPPIVSLPHLNPHSFYHSDTGLLRLSWKRGR